MGRRRILSMSIFIFYILCLIVSVHCKFNHLLFCNFIWPMLCFLIHNCRGKYAYLKFFTWTMAVSIWLNTSEPEMSFVSSFVAVSALGPWLCVVKNMLKSWCKAIWHVFHSAVLRPARCVERNILTDLVLRAACRELFCLFVMFLWISPTLLSAEWCHRGNYANTEG